MDSYVVETPAILDSLFHKVVNTTSTPIRRGGAWVETEWRILTQKIYIASHCLALADVRQAEKRGLSKGRLFYYSTHMHCYYCICWVEVKSEHSHFRKSGHMHIL